MLEQTLSILEKEDLIDLIAAYDRYIVEYSENTSGFAPLSVSKFHANSAQKEEDNMLDAPEEQLSLAERREQLLREKAYDKEEHYKNIRKKIANTIDYAFKLPGLVLRVEELLLKDGRVCVTGFGCLCQDGDCSHTKGFPEYLKSFEATWDKKGVKVYYSIGGVFLVLDNSSRGYGTKKINYKDFE